MTVTITFDPVTEELELHQALYAGVMARSIEDTSARIRGWLKHGIPKNKEVEDLLKELQELLLSGRQVADSSLVSG